LVRRLRAGSGQARETRRGPKDARNGRDHVRCSPPLASRDACREFGVVLASVIYAHRRRLRVDGPCVKPRASRRIRPTAGQTRVRHGSLAPLGTERRRWRRMILSELEIYLLGRPRVTRDGEAAPNPRGYKAWGLLAYLLRSQHAPSRAELVLLLFGEAED